MSEAYTPIDWEWRERNYDQCVRQGGDCQYVVLVHKSFCWSGEIYVFADQVRIENGALVFYKIWKKGSPDEKRDSHFAIAAGNWQAFDSVSCIDGIGGLGILSWRGRFKCDSLDPDPAPCWAEVANGQPATPEQEKKDNKPNSRNIGDSLRFDVLKRSNFRCVYCGKTSNQTSLEIDHIKPFSKGGTNELKNLQAVCGRCNKGKSDKVVEVTS